MTIERVSIRDPQYPALLREIFDPPEYLYYWGNLSCLELPCIGVVGTRRASAYGLSQAHHFGKQLAQHGVCVVSGLAFGVDAAAHEGALEGHGPTAAVVAQDLKNLRPRAHLKLVKRIVEGGGVVISEHGEHHPSLKHEYLVRNRVIAGLSKAVVLIEAGQPSGALNTAKHAVDNNREVMALPGRVTDPLSQGCFKMLKDGATLVTEPKDVLEALSISWKDSQILLKAEHLSLYEHIKAGPQRPEALKKIFKGSLMELFGCLTEMEMEGLLRRLPDQSYCVVD